MPSKVTVTFIDDATNESFGVTKMPAIDLPESFEIDTTLHLGDDDWTVVQAIPKTRDEYSKSKSLILRLRRKEMLDPRSILFSLPSICGTIPVLGEQPLSGDELVLHEDDWRQLELVSQDLSSDVDTEIEMIRQLHENSFAEVGWREIHVRKNPEFPISRAIQLADLEDALNFRGKSTGVTYRGAPSRIADGFSFHINGLTVYGLAPNGIAHTVAIDQYLEKMPDADSIVLLKKLANSSHLDLVCWCRCAKVAPNDPLFDSILFE